MDTYRLFKIDGVICKQFFKNSIKMIRGREMEVEGDMLV
jgi:hypothetical protein